MALQLNIKSEDAYRLASELAELTGESLTAAVTAALRERLERERQARETEARVERLLALGQEIRARIGVGGDGDAGSQAGHPAGDGNGGEAAR